MQTEQKQERFGFHRNSPERTPSSVNQADLHFDTSLHYTITRCVTLCDEMVDAVRPEATAVQKVLKRSRSL